jgi:hypothetical protein
MTRARITATAALAAVLLAGGAIASLATSSGATSSATPVSMSHAAPVSTAHRTPRRSTTVATVRSSPTTAATVSAEPTVSSTAGVIATTATTPSTSKGVPTSPSSQPPSASAATPGPAAQPVGPAALASRPATSDPTPPVVPPSPSASYPVPTADPWAGGAIAGEQVCAIGVQHPVSDSVAIGWGPCSTAPAELAWLWGQFGPYTTIAYPVSAAGVWPPEIAALWPVPPLGTGNQPIATSFEVPTLDPWSPRGAAGVPTTSVCTIGVSFPTSPGTGEVLRGPCVAAVAETAWLWAQYGPTGLTMPYFGDFPPGVTP